MTQKDKHQLLVGEIILASREVVGAYQTNKISEMKKALEKLEEKFLKLDRLSIEMLESEE